MRRRDVAGGCVRALSEVARAPEHDRSAEQRRLAAAARAGHEEQAAARVEVVTNCVVRSEAPGEEVALLGRADDAPRPRLPVRCPVRIPLDRRLDQLRDLGKAGCDCIDGHEPAKASVVAIVDGVARPAHDDAEQLRALPADGGELDDGPAAVAEADALPRVRNLEAGTRCCVGRVVELHAVAAGRRVLAGG